LPWFNAMLGVTFLMFLNIATIVYAVLFSCKIFLPNPQSNNPYKIIIAFLLLAINYFFLFGGKKHYQIMVLEPGEGIDPYASYGTYIGKETDLGYSLFYSYHSTMKGGTSSIGIGIHVPGILGVNAGAVSGGVSLGGTIGSYNLTLSISFETGFGYDTNHVDEENGTINGSFYNTGVSVPGAAAIVTLGAVATYIIQSIETLPPL